MKKLLPLLALFSVFSPLLVSAQRIVSDNRQIHTAYILSLTRLSNPRMGAFGEIGAVSSDFYFDAGLSQNPASLANPYSDVGGMISYNPENAIGIDDYNLTDIKAFYKFSEKDFVGMNIRYYSQGSVHLTNENGEKLPEENPYDMVLQTSWAHRFNKTISAGLSLKYVRSDFGKNTFINGRVAGNDLAIDLGVQWRKQIEIRKSMKFNYAFGAVLNDLGPKMRLSNSGGGGFLPSTIRVGVLAGPEFLISDEFKLNVDMAYQVDKLLAPTPPIYEYDSDGNRTGNIEKGYDPNISSFRAIFQSFYDAPGGLNEELHELIHKFGLETRMTYSDLGFVAVRLGKVTEHESKGASRTSYGFGLGAYGFTADVQFVEYEIKTNPQPKTWIASVGYRARLGEMFRF